MNTPTQKLETRSTPTWFGSLWLRTTTAQAIRTAPVIAMLQHLLEILRDPQVPADQAYTSLRRAVTLLRVLDAEAGTRRSRQDVEHPGGRHYVATLDDVARSAESTRFAAQWLCGSPEAAIRTRPVIEVVEELLEILLDEFTPAHDIQISLRRAVRLLSVFVADHQRGNPASEK
jgi:hypothetical protein